MYGRVLNIGTTGDNWISFPLVELKVQLVEPQSWQLAGAAIDA